MRNRRALSTVVGAVFFIIATTTVITYVTYSMNSIENFSNSVVVSQSQNVDRGSEGIKISAVQINNGKFNMTVSNTGSLPIHLTRLWVSNQDLVTPSDIRADLNIRIDPGKVQYNIGQSTSISAISTTSYNLKVVTERGNAATFQVSPNVSTRIQIIMPSTVGLDTSFRVTTLITNNSTNPNNIANLVPVLTNNGTLTKTDGPNPSSIATLLQGNTVAFTSTYLASSTAKTVQFNASYTGAPKGAFSLSNIAIASLTSAEKASNSQWSQAASRVGILISGIPNPINAANPTQYGKWGVGIINPLDRSVDVYSVGIQYYATPSTVLGINMVEPSANWRIVDLGSTGMVIWEGGTSPVSIAAKDVGQFRVEMDYKQTNTPASETLVLIQALTSEGKLTTIYTVSLADTHPMINAFYTSNTSDPTNNWSYTIKGIKSQKNDQIFNATVYNSASVTLNSKINLIILLPSDFTDVKDVSAGTNGWDAATIVINPDNSHVIKVQTTAISLSGGIYKTYQFSADAPAVTSDKLYVFQTTTVYPSFKSGPQIQLASALSEAGVEVIP